LQEASNPDSTLRFDNYELNLRAGELLKGGRKIRLQEQPFRILAILLEKPGQVVTREELCEQLWPADTFVDFDHSLNTAVKKLRQALNDEAEKPRYIETLPKRGYRFIGPAAVNVPPQQPSSASSGVANGTAAATEAVAGFPDAAEEAPARASRRWILAPLALLVAALGAGGFFLFRRAPALTEKDTLVLADFENSTGDAVFDDALKQGLAVQLGQSPYLSILSDEKVRDTLKLMGRAPGDRLTPVLAREVCQRGGSEAYLTGSIANLGNQYVLGLSAMNCRTGEAISRQQAQVARKEDVLNALGAAAKLLRNKLGESLGSIQKYDTPIEQATTPSLEALKAFSLGVQTSHEKGEVAAIPFFKRAIEVDPNFALAYEALGGTYVALGEPAQAAEMIQKAYDRRERVSNREQFDITAEFQIGVTGDLEKANETAQVWAHAYPRDAGPHQRMAWSYELMGRYEKAIAENLEAIRRDPSFALIYSNLMEDYTSLNRLADAKATYQRAIDQRLDGTYLHADYYVIAFLEDDRGELLRQVALAKDMPGSEDWLFSLQSDTAAYSGELTTARQFSLRAVDSAQRNDLKEVAAIWKLNAAIREVEFGNDREARLAVEEGLKLASTRDSQMLAGVVLARTREDSRAEGIAANLAKQFPQNTELRHYWLPSIRAAIQLNRKNPSEALKALEPALEYELGYPRPQLEGGSLIYPAYLRGQAYLQLRQGKEAAAEFQKFIEWRSDVANCPFGALAHLWLGRSFAMQGERAKARAAYEKFLALWKGADAAIPILRAAKSEYSKLPAK
jgi:DNA-binding winged helix-turn-helix (wHTH) protein/tetratricopeptide (TPR) repeat protein